MISEQENFGILDVIENDMCVGCGACAATHDSAIQIKLNENGQFQARIETSLLSNEFIAAIS